MAKSRVLDMRYSDMIKYFSFCKTDLELVFPKSWIGLQVIFLCAFVISAYGCSNKEDDLGGIGPKEPQPEEIIGFDASYHYELARPVADRNFFALMKLVNDESAIAVLKENATFDAVLKEHLAKLSHELSNSEATVASIGLSMRFSEEEIIDILEQIKIVANQEALKNVIQKHLKPSGAYQIYAGYTDDEFLKYAIRECLFGINKIIDVYTQGLSPLGGSKDIGLYHQNNNTYKPNYLEDLKKSLTKLHEEMGNMELFFQPSLEFSLMLLHINNREEAGEFEPLQEKENAAAYAFIQELRWEDYPYASMLLLGDSPNSPGDDPNISKSAKKRVEFAVENLKAGLAPVVIISGSNVYPTMSPYFEAIEMKKYMMETYDIDEKHILVDPHARHTTSNLRNVSRYIFRYGIPPERKSIITATESHIDIVVHTDFAKRCNQYFGFMPGSLGKRVSATTVEFTPEVKSLTTQPSLDPLDP